MGIPVLEVGLCGDVLEVDVDAAEVYAGDALVPDELVDDAAEVVAGARRLLGRSGETIQLA